MYVSAVEIRSGSNCLQLLPALIESIKQAPLQKTVKGNVTWPPYEISPPTTGELTQDYLWQVGHNHTCYKSRIISASNANELYQNGRLRHHRNRNLSLRHCRNTFSAWSVSIQPNSLRQHWLCDWCSRRHVPSHQGDRQVQEECLDYRRRLFATHGASFCGFSAT
jgi:hypothetical protein